MSKVNGVTCLESRRYKGFIIDKNVSEYGTIFYSIIKINPKEKKKPFHVHINKRKAAEDIVNCYYARNKCRFSRLIRNRALSLELNQKVMF